MKFLFLCAMGINRSPTAASVARRIASEKGLDIELYYGGIDYALAECYRLDSEETKQKHIKNFQQYDQIFVMEEYMKRELINSFNVDKRKINCLYIPDEYKRDDPELIEILENILRTHIGVQL